MMLFVVLGVLHQFVGNLCLIYRCAGGGIILAVYLDLVIASVWCLGRERFVSEAFWPANRVLFLDVVAFTVNWMKPQVLQQNQTTCFQYRAEPKWLYSKKKGS
jgi:hypothetical protein